MRYFLVFLYLIIYCIECSGMDGQYLTGSGEFSSPQVSPTPTPFPSPHESPFLSPKSDPSRPPTSGSFSYEFNEENPGHLQSPTPSNPTLIVPEVHVPPSGQTSSSLSSYFSTPSARDNYKKENPDGRQHAIYKIHKKLKALTSCFDQSGFLRFKLEIHCAVIQILENETTGAKILNEPFNLDVFGYKECTILHLAILFLPNEIDKDQIKSLILKGTKIDARCYIIQGEYCFFFTPLDLAILGNHKALAKQLYHMNAPYSDLVKDELNEMLGLNQQDQSQSQKNCCNIT